MSGTASPDTFTIKALCPDTWDAFADLAERHNGVWGGCWCTWFHTMAGEKTRIVGQLPVQDAAPRAHEAKGVVRVEAAREQARRQGGPDLLAPAADGTYPRLSQA